ncbi:D-threo-aldose 1-dehydrogenase [Microlunatus soli]|uniref:D-threo-aldose 1-dehydrogenase n=2 Tax=Microlunatus soli TaxID=630515 RepID=A0A1H1QN66_9ACTN|nr:D-threo-aldose 1-dehydrogenase [Microlunatus soli]
MQRRKIGRTGLEVTELGFGAAPIGNLYRAITDEQSEATVDAAWEGGIRYFDTAPHYGLGLAEQRLGAALQKRPRDGYVLSTKVGRLLVSSGESDHDQEGFDLESDLTRVRDYSAAGVRRSLDESRQRLGLDRIDIALVHDPDDHLRQAATESIPALCELRDAGEIGAVGVGMNYVQPLLELATHDYPAGVGIDVILVAGRWTLLDRTARPLLDACADRGISVIAAAPFNSGLLAGAEPPADGRFNYEPATPEVMAKAREFAAVARAAGTELPHAAMRFPLRHPAVAAALAGMQTPAEVAANVACADDLPESAWQRIEAVEPALG